MPPCQLADVSHMSYQIFRAEIFKYPRRVECSMSNDRLQFMGTDDLVVAPEFGDVDEYMSIAADWDTHTVKNTLWMLIHEARDEIDELADVDIRRLNVVFTPASGSDKRGAGFLNYMPDTGVSHMALSLRWLDRTDADEDFMRGVVRHELCHLKMYQEGLLHHREYGEPFQTLLRDVGAPTGTLWHDVDVAYNYRL